MMRFVSSLVIVCMLSVSFNAFATEPSFPSSPTLQPGETPIGAVISPMKKGQNAPFTGLLLSPAAVAAIIVQFQNAQNETDIQIKKAVDTAKATDQLKIDDLNAQLQEIKTTSTTMIKNRDVEIAELTKKVSDDEKNKPNLMLWVGGGALGGIVMTVLTVFAVSRASK